MTLVTLCNQACRCCVQGRDGPAGQETGGSEEDAQRLPEPHLLQTGVPGAAHAGHIQTSERESSLID